MTEPVLIALLFADRVITEDNQKKGIIGTFSRFYAPQFPAAFAPWFIYVAITNIAHGKHPIGMTVTNRETQQVILSINGDLQSQEPTTPDDVVELVMPVANAVFPAPGKYDVAIVMDGQLLSSRILQAERLVLQSGG